MTTVDELLGTAKETLERDGLPACQLAVAHEGELVVFETFGDANNDTRFAIFSCTKPIVASAVWLLIAEGVLDVTKRVVEYVPEFATNGKDIVTVEQVMLHTSGFPNAVMPEGDGANADARRSRFAEWSLEWEPDSRFEYHGGSAHWVLADLIERLGGLDFRDYIEQHVTTPLGLPRLLGMPADGDDEFATLTPVGDASDSVLGLRMNDPAVRAEGVPGGGGIMRTADLALFYQALLHNPGGLWDADLLHDVKTNVRCTFPDNLLQVPVNRTLGLVLAGDDGQHFMRYGSFGPSNSPKSIGHAGAHMQIGWADPATGISFAYCCNGVDSDQMKEGVRGVQLSDLAASLAL